jgi:predicted DNA-binding protein with PD1-like motif
MFFIKSILMIFSLVSTYTAFAGSYIAVDKDSCGKMVGSQESFVLVLKTGEKLQEGIKQCANDAHMVGASVQGIGQFLNPTFAYYGPNAQPHIISLEGTYEVISLNGNISLSGGSYYTHIHAVLGNDQLEARAGHIKESIIGATAELVITPFSKPLVRKVNQETGFGPIITAD